MMCVCVCVFMAFLCQNNHITLVQSEWEATSDVHGVGQPGDAGSSAQPLLLHLPSIPPGLSDPIKVQ